MNGKFEAYPHGKVKPLGFPVDDSAHQRNRAPPCPVC